MTTEQIKKEINKLESDFYTVPCMIEAQKILDRIEELKNKLK